MSDVGGVVLRPCEVLEDEFAHLHGPLPANYPKSGAPEIREAALRPLLHAQDRAALCLSGGGIRSATFSLGVLQGLARRGWLSQFHYLSTVSGGGYIGSWLSSYVHREDLGTVVRALGTPQAAPDPEPAPIRRLRAYSNYLSPVWGFSVDFVTLISTLLRNLLLHWSVLIPLMMAALLLPRINVAVIELIGIEPAGWLVLPVVLVFLASVWGIAYSVSDLPGADAHRPATNRFLVGCFLPLVFAAIMLSWTWSWYANLSVRSQASWDQWYWFAAAGAAMHLLGVLLGIWLRTIRPAAPGPPVTGAPRDLVSDRYSGLVDLLLVLGSGAAGGLVLMAGVHLLFPVSWLDGSKEWSLQHPAAREIFACLAVPFLLACFWLSTAVYAGLANKITTEGDREWWARSGAWSIFASLAWIGAHVLVIFAPQWILSSPAVAPYLAGGGAVSGLVTSLVGYWSQKGLGHLAEQGKGLLRLAGRRLLDIAALAFIVALLLALSLLLSAGLNWVTPPTALPTGSLLDWKAYRAVLHRVPLDVLVEIFLLCAGFGLSLSAIVGINTFSLHSMYGNRLVRAYLGATRRVRYPHLFTGFDPDDNLKMVFLAEPRRPLFHVVNIALNMVMARGGRLEWQERKAASFTVSPLHSGSRALGYQPTDSYSGGVSLGRAFTTSGAAASPNMGYHSSPLVTFVMAFFNARLGWWLPNPGERGRRVWGRSEPRVGALRLLDEALSRTTDESSYVYLSDGGHFENLGLYEMVYRRCRRIIVVDASCDPDYKFEDLENAIRKIRVDFGVPIDFPTLPTPDYARERNAHFTYGRIGYSVVDPGQADGVIVYVKPVLSGHEPVDVRRYAETNAEKGNKFPHQSTKDQFFDEAQFESYRQLGYDSIMAEPFPRPDQPLEPPGKSGDVVERATQR